MPHLLILETLLKLAGGAALLLFPGTIIKLLGLPPASDGFWPRLVGALLMGLSGAFYLEARFAGSKGMGLGGAVIVNCVVAATLVLSMTLGGTAKPRGRAALWLLVMILVGLSLIQIAQI